MTSWRAGIQNCVFGRSPPEQLNEWNKLNDGLISFSITRIWRLTSQNVCQHTGLGLVFFLIIDQPVFKGYRWFTAALFCLIWHIGNGQLQKWKASFFLEGEAMERSWDDSGDFSRWRSGGQKWDHILKWIHLLIWSSVHLFYGVRALRNEGSGSFRFFALCWWNVRRSASMPLRLFYEESEWIGRKGECIMGRRFPEPRSVFMPRSFILVARWFSLVKMPGHFPLPIYWFDKCRFGHNIRPRMMQYHLPLLHPESFSYLVIFHQKELPSLIGFSSVALWHVVRGDTTHLPALNMVTLRHVAVTKGSLWRQNDN